MRGVVFDLKQTGKVDLEESREPKEKTKRQTIGNGLKHDSLLSLFAFKTKKRACPSAPTMADIAATMPLTPRIHLY